MGYVDKNLMGGEEIRYRGEMHRFRYFWGAFWLVIGALTMMSDFGLGMFMVMLSCVLILLAFIDIKTSEFVITNRRVVMKQGLIFRRFTNLPLNKVESVGVEDDIFSRLIGFGSIRVVGTGGSQQRFSLLKEPLEFSININHAAGDMKLPFYS